MNNQEELYETKVLPDLKIALVKLIDQVLKSDEVRKHKERLKELRVLDKLEQKNIEKEKLKLEMGSDYESSSESSILEELEFINKSESHESDKDDKDSSVNLEISHREHNENKKEKEHSSNNKEKNEKRKLEKKRMTEILYKKKEEKPFNPLFYLGTLLKNMQATKPEEESTRPIKNNKKSVKIMEEPKAVLELDDIVNKDRVDTEENEASP